MKSGAEHLDSFRQEGTSRRQFFLSRVDVWRVVAAFAFATLILVLAGLGLSGFSIQWGILAWLLLSMSGYWVVNRLLHAQRGAAGETERDGVMWAVPLALGLLPATVFLLSGSVYARTFTLIAWSLVPVVVVQLVRPEIPQDSQPRYLEGQGLLAGLRTLLKSRLIVAVSESDSAQVGGKARMRLSASTGIYYLVFGFTAGGMLALNHAIAELDGDSLEGQRLAFWGSLLGVYAVGVAAFLAAFMRLVAATYDTPAEKAGWRLQEEERQILALLWALSTVNVIGTSACVLALPLLGKISDAI